MIEKAAANVVFFQFLDVWDSVELSGLDGQVEHPLQGREIPVDRRVRWNFPVVRFFLLSRGDVSTDRVGSNVLGLHPLKVTAEVLSSRKIRAYKFPGKARRVPFRHN